MGVPGADTRHRHRVENSGGRRLFAKLAGDADGAEDLRHEAAILELLQRRCPETARLAAACAGWSEERGALLLEELPGESLAQRTAAAGAADVGAATALGLAIGRLHEEGGVAASEAPRARAVHAGVHRPTPEDFGRMTAAGADLIALLQRSRPLCDRLDHLCVPWDREMTLIHGDLRPENVILTDSAGALRLVDWEFAGRGEALWDAACLMAAWLGAWLWSVPQIPCLPPGELLPEAALPLAGVRPAAVAFWTAYAERRALDATTSDRALRRVLDLVGIRLVQLAVTAADAEDLRAVPVLHLQVAANVLERPEAAAEELLGIGWRHV